MDISEVPESHLLCHVMMLMSHSLQRGQPPAFISKPTIIGYSPIVRIFLPPPPLHLATSWHAILSQIVSNFITQICIKACYDHIIEGYQGDVVLNEIPFLKRQLCSPR